MYLTVYVLFVCASYVCFSVHATRCASIYNNILFYNGSTQYYADANEAESWMKEKDPLVSSVDYGRDGTTAKVSETFTICDPLSEKPPF